MCGVYRLRIGIIWGVGMLRGWTVKIYKALLVSHVIYQNMPILNISSIH